MNHGELSLNMVSTSETLKILCIQFTVGNASARILHQEKSCVHCNQVLSLEYGFAPK
jgi:hypothetical protein